MEIIQKIKQIKLVAEISPNEKEIVVNALRSLIRESTTHEVEGEGAVTFHPIHQFSINEFDELTLVMNYFEDQMD